MPRDFSFAVGGMTCASCVRFVEKELGKVPGVEFIALNLTDGKAYAVTDGRPEWTDLARVVKKAGYIPLEEVPTEDEAAQAFQTAKRRVVIAWAVALPAMVLMILHMSGIHMEWLPAAELATGLAVLIGPGRRILKGAWTALTHRHANMDVLVSLGTLAAWSTAALALAGFSIRSFGSLAPMLPAFHLTGRLIEERLRRRAGADLRALMSTGDGTARVIVSESSKGSYEDRTGTEIHDIPVDAVQVGATIRVLSGERIPLDGRVLSGSAAVSEAMVTGEPLPVLKNPGDELIGGTVLESGNLDFEVLRKGEDAFLSRMLALVEQAQGTQVPLQALADRVAGVFVPVVFLLAMATFAGWVLFYPALSPLLTRAASLLPWVPADAGPWTTAVFAMVSMLVVACPCALGLATPMAVSVGGGLAARRGLLIKGGEALQTAGKLDVLVFDKTGTLTEGRPRVVWSNLESSDIPAVAALEAWSVHPLARAVNDWAAGSEKYPDKPGDSGISDIQEIAGEGILGLVNGVSWKVGRPENPVQAAESVPAGTGAALTVIEVSREGRIAGYIALADPVKTEAARAIADLKSRGVRPVMATGDTEETALSVARLVGIPTEDVHGSLHPEDKLRIVQEYQKSGLRTGMIGDGINDGAALKASDTGFAMAQGTDLSMEAGDVVITHGGLEKIIEALDLSAMMVRKIKGNLTWAFAYNLVALPGAALALIHPLIAEAAMSLSSVGVVLNSISIRNVAHRRRRKDTAVTGYEFDVSGMSCGHCVARVEEALSKSGTDIKVNLDAGTAVVHSDRSVDVLLADLEESGYPASLKS